MDETLRSVAKYSPIAKDASTAAKRRESLRKFLESRSIDLDWIMEG